MSRPLGTTPSREASWKRVFESVSSGTPPPAEAGPLPSDPLGGRYRVLSTIGRGAMGTVYRVEDRLTDRLVTLKRLRKPRPLPSAPDSNDQRLDLAREFSLLASLRHPNVITVLDYGFDDEGVPFFTMELEEDARSIVEAGRHTALSVQIDLLVQTLRALAYLHRHGILHRDLKPDNVVVVATHVKVLDFGLSTHLTALDPSEDGWVGTLAYVAPEVLSGEPPTIRSDLYSFGMIAYEVLLGEYSFQDVDDSALGAHILSTELPRDRDDVDERLRPWLARLLAKDPARRFESARAVAHALGEAVGQTLEIETATTRESFLQAAPFVGRQQQLERVGAAVNAARQGRGSAHLIGGESGVGKSRLLDEVRTRALVRGVRVLRGQARSRGGAPYHVWRDVVTEAAVHVELGDEDVAVLRAIAPDLGTRLGRPVAEAPAVAPEAAQTRLLLAVEELFRAQRETTLVMLDDLHWAGSESLWLLARLAQAAPELRLVLIGSYRDDEFPGLPAAVEGAAILPIGRLTREEIENLAVAMMGDVARHPELITLLVRETEGIPFFVVEVVRTLAESAAGLEEIVGSALPTRVVSGNMERMVRRRLNRVPADALAPLRMAAVQGRRIDPLALAWAHPGLDVADWAERCVAAAVLEPSGDSWQFAHDKLREQLLADTSAATIGPLHRRVAEALEATRDDREQVVAALADHWREAGDPEREAEYAFRAGLQALESGACLEAVGHLSRVRELIEQPAVAGSEESGGFGRWRPRLDPNARVDPDAPTFRLGVIEGALTDAYFRLGNLRLAREHGIRALRLFGHRVPTGAAGNALAVGRQIGLRGVQGLLGIRSADRERAGRATRPVAQVLMRLIDTYFYSLEAGPLAWSILRMVNESAPYGDSPELARAYCLGALLAGMSSLKGQGETWLERAIAIADRCGTDADRGWVRARVGVFRLSFGEWDLASNAAAEACTLAQQVGDLRSFEEDRCMSALLELYRARYATSLDHTRAAFTTTLRSGDEQLRAASVLIEADALLRLGRVDEALQRSRQGLAYMESGEELSVRSELTMGLGIHAGACLRAGDLEAAVQSASRAVDLMTMSAPVTYWMQSPIAHTLDTLLAALETHGSSGAWRWDLRTKIRPMVRVARQYAWLFPMGRPQALLASGRWAWLRGRPRRAMARWRRAAKVARALQMPYEEARARFELGRSLPPHGAGRASHLAAAADGFERIGCRWELERVRALQASPTAPPDPWAAHA